MKVYQKILLLSLLVVVIPSMALLYYFAQKTEHEGDQLLDSLLYRRYLAISSVFDSIQGELLIVAIAAVNQNDFGELYRYFDEVSLGHDIMDLDDEQRKSILRYAPVKRFHITEGRMVVDLKVPMFMEPHGDLAYAHLQTYLMQDTLQKDFYASDRERYAVYRIEQDEPVIEITGFADTFSRPITRNLVDQELLRRVINERAYAFQRDVRIGLHTYNLIAFPIHDEERTIGVFVVGIQREEMAGVVSSMKRNVEYTLLTGLFLAVLLTFLITHQLVRPIRRIEGFAQRVAAGDVGEMLAMQRKDEIGSLAGHINRMVNTLRSLLQREEDYSHKLEQDVETRTQELSASNQQLQQEIVERKQAEEERKILEAQLAHAQKMESIGRLAGGVAHDFNNMLSVILGNTELALDTVNPSDPVHAELMEIRNAVTRSADLTRQLLAFARKQTVAPQVFDLNKTVEGMLKMLRRLIGEDIELVWRPSECPQQIKMDPSQLDQLLANLCVNARDAIHGTGRITLTTSATSFDENECALFEDLAPGDYVSLEICDTGAGMDEHTLQHLFEPFFTTKAPGQGTGLGCATVYGIVKQNRGYIQVESRQGQGSRFLIYLPRQKTALQPRDIIEPPLSRTAGDETILLVEDEPAILKMTLSMLKRLGYRVMTAATPGDALKSARTYPGTIHLLITDVIMPEMNGRELATELCQVYPDIRCLYISGYNDDVIAQHGVLEEGMHFLQKPFHIEMLHKSILAALSAPSFVAKDPTSSSS